jgi:serine/threonine-protein kinase
MGTTHYMAPEQARGELSLIGRRTDVYALGATLYELLAGKPPFHQAGELECLRLILEAEIPPLRSVVPDIHPELDTIVMKCLEKEITQRYDSARALAEDLRRFQDGEPILARPSTLFYRASKRARKNRALVALGAAALIVAGALGAFGLNARVTAASQAQWAQHFGQEAERIEALLRYTRLQPRHDIRFELTQVVERVRTMEAEMEKAGRQARGPGSYALGRAYLALGDPERARVDLDRAWNAGFRVPDVSYARGRVLGQLFARALLKARTLQDSGLRRARIQELEETLRDPAVAQLRQGRGSTMEPASFQEGLLALYERRYGDALRAARDAARSAPWFYESRALEAEVDLTQARLSTDPGAALQHLASAGQALAAAAATAPSDPGLEDLLARRWLEEMSLRRHEGQAFPEQFRALQAACRDWKAIAPDAPGPDARLAWGDLEQARISPPAERDDLLHRAIILADTVLSANPDHSEALGALAAALQLQAYAALNAGRDPRLALDRAQTLLQRALQGDNAPFELFEPFAGVLWARVEFERIQGHDPAPAVAEALQAIRHLAQRYPRVADFQGFLGGIQVELADYQACHGLDPGPVAARAMVDLETAIRMAPTRFEFWFSKGNAYLALAEYQVLAGLPAEAAIAAGEAAYRSAIGFNSATAGPALGLGELGLLRCQDQESQGRNPMPALAQAEAALAPARAISDNWRVPLFDARAALLRSQWNPDPAEAQAALALADKKVAQAAVQASNDPSFLVVQAQVQLAWARRNPASAPARILQGRREIQTALKKDPGFLPAKRLLTDLN